MLMTRARDALAVTSALLVIGSVSTCWAGPFGVDVESFDLEKFDCSLNAGAVYDYSCEGIKSDNPDFYSFDVKYSEKSGLCAIVAYGPEVFGDNEFGTLTHAAVEKVYESVSQIYGAGVRIDALRPNAVWTRPDEWLKSLDEGERVFGYHGNVVSGGIVSYIIFASQNGFPENSLVISQFNLKDPYTNCSD